MEKPLTHINPIINRADRRQADKEAAKQFEKLQSTESEFYELLFDSGYGYETLYRWMRFAIHISRGNFISKRMRYVEINKAYHNNLAPIESESIINDRVKNILEKVREKFYIW